MMRPHRARPSPGHRAGCKCQATDDSNNISSFPYTSNDGKRLQKATLQHVDALAQHVFGSPKGSSPDPWALGWQANERSLWSSELKVQLIRRIASDELGISEEEMAWRMDQLLLLLPGLAQRLARAPPKLVARAATHTPQIAMRLMRLKAAFPSADVAMMVGNRLSLLLDDDITDIDSTAGELRKLLPGLDVDRFVAEYPLVLDLQCFKRALEDCKLLLNKDPSEVLRANPQLVLNLVKGKNMVPYDQLTNPWA